MSDGIARVLGSPRLARPAVAQLPRSIAGIERLAAPSRRRDGTAVTDQRRRRVFARRCGPGSRRRSARRSGCCTRVRSRLTGDRRRSLLRRVIRVSRSRGVRAKALRGGAPGGFGRRRLRGRWRIYRKRESRLLVRGLKGRAAGGRRRLGRSCGGSASWGEIACIAPKNASQDEVPHAHDRGAQGGKRCDFPGGLRRYAASIGSRVTARAFPCRGEQASEDATGTERRARPPSSGTDAGMVYRLQLPQ